MTNGTRFLLGCLLVATTGCAAGAGRSAAPAAAAVRAPTLVLDYSFADGAIAYARGDSSQRSQLLALPALDAMLRHHRSSGGNLSREALLDEILAKPFNPDHAAAVIAFWRQHEASLATAVAVAGKYLPSGSLPDRVGVFFEVNYDAAVVAPPDMAINAAFERFFENPGEIAYTAAHELHHVGFAALRPLPTWIFGTSEEMVKAIDFATQMEGLAVYSLYEQRTHDGALVGDPDYAVFGDSKMARDVCEKYRAAWQKARLVSPRDQGNVDPILAAMSSGERLWYQFGALVAQRIERDGGRERLLESITRPSLFIAARQQLMQACETL